MLWKMDASPFIWRHSSAFYEDVLPTTVSETRWLRHIKSQYIPGIHCNLLNPNCIMAPKQPKNTLTYIQDNRNSEVHPYFYRLLVPFPA
ncbi:Os01g0360333 [Oryza sativa Japonica Group]|uniref:Os01g0360333 protein n=1 Tax=Oryza sativa subsp. japonica TaxID=39947 RepID=A0A0P0V317_ORYSJ|nr:hypothetical protein EE612_002575 [Oryza sativa]BAS72096.1 Os01g0360333 [Oryza sativa Japonica Group]